MLLGKDIAEIEKVKQECKPLADFIREELGTDTILKDYNLEKDLQSHIFRFDTDNIDESIEESNRMEYNIRIFIKNNPSYTYKKEYQNNDGIHTTFFVINKKDATPKTSA